MVEAPASERLHHLVEPRADARHLRLRDPRLRAQRGHQIVHRSGGHPGHVGLHDDRVQGPVDAPARLEHRRQQRALAKLGDPQLDVSGLGGQQPRPVPVALIHTSIAALIAPGADRLGDLGLDQLLEHQTHRAAHQLRAATGAKRLPQLRCVSIRKGHRCVLLDESVISLTEDHADGPPSGGPLRLPQTPPLGGTLPNISNPPPSVLALTAIPNRLYNHPDWRSKYVARLKGLLDTAWDEEDLLAVVDAMAATVQRHALPEAREAAAADTERVRKFILKRRGEILADLTPEPPEWPEPEADIPLTAGSGTLEITFQTTWGSNLSANPLEAGTISSLRLDGSEESVEGMGIFAGHSSPEERGLLPEVDQPASIVVASVDDDGSISGMTVAVDLDLLAAGATLVMGADAIAGVTWFIPPGASAPDRFSPFTEGTLELSAAGTTPGDPIAGTFSGVYGYAASLTGGDSPDPTPGAANQP